MLFDKGHNSNEASGPTQPVITTENMNLTNDISSGTDAYVKFSDVDPHWLYAGRIQVNKIPKYISNYLPKKNIFNSVPKPLRLATFFRFSLEKYNFLRKKNKKPLLVELCFPLNFIPLDPGSYHWSNCLPQLKLV